MANFFDILFNRKPKKPDFSGVDSRTTSSERTTTGGGAGGTIRPDFSRPGNSQSTAPDFGNVRSRVDSTERVRGQGGAGGTGRGGARDTGRATARLYTVVAGDTLSHIAQHHYGDASRWPAIFEANRDKLSDPDRIFPGQVLRLPDDDTAH